MILTWAQAGDHSRKRGDHQQLRVKMGDSDRRTGKATENPQGPARRGGDPSTCQAFSPCQEVYTSSHLMGTLRGSSQCTD